MPIKIFQPLLALIWNSHFIRDSNHHEGKTLRPTKHENVLNLSPFGCWLGIRCDRWNFQSVNENDEYLAVRTTSPLATLNRIAISSNITPAGIYKPPWFRLQTIVRLFNDGSQRYILAFAQYFKSNAPF